MLQYNLGNIGFPAIILNNKELICGYSHVLLGCSLFIMLYKSLNKIKLVTYNGVLNFFDKYSYFIYLTHQIFILREFSIMNLTEFLWLNICIVFATSIISGMLLYWIYVIVLKMWNGFIKYFNIIYSKI